MSGITLQRLTGAGAPSLLGTAFDLAPLGCTQAEYALSGIANAYVRTPGGVIVTERAEFTTRLLVYRPWDYVAFNGTVWTEWLNVSGGLDVGAEWILLHTELMRSGAAWVGVSAQQVGVTGGGGLIGFSGAGLTGTDPERYGVLCHPGDRFSYDIPTAVLSGLGNEGNLIAFLCGGTVPFDAGTLRSRYPSRAAYLDQFREATANAVAAGFILAADAPEITAIAAINTEPWNCLSSATGGAQGGTHALYP